ncbi:response regulator [Patescibacteria group bacterium]|nr:response regulator [Patescibacteria group bacterium]
MPPNTPSKRTILLIEDDVFVKDLYERTLKRRGYRVIVAEDGEMGLEAAHARADEIELVLLDIMLPKVNGIEVLKKLVEDGLTKKFTVVLITNLGQESIIKEAFDIGARGYMLKARLLPREIVDKVDEFFQTGVFPVSEANGL